MVNREGCTAWRYSTEGRDKTCIRLANIGPVFSTANSHPLRFEEWTESKGDNGTTCTPPVGIQRANDIVRRRSPQPREISHDQA